MRWSHTAIKRTPTLNETLSTVRVFKMDSIVDNLLRLHQHLHATILMDVGWYMLCANIKINKQTKTGSPNEFVHK